MDKIDRHIKTVVGLAASTAHAAVDGYFETVRQEIEEAFDPLFAETLDPAVKSEFDHGRWAHGAFDGYADELASIMSEVEESFRKALVTGDMAYDDIPLEDYVSRLLIKTEKTPREYKAA